MNELHQWGFPYFVTAHCPVVRIVSNGFFMRPGIFGNSVASRGWWLRIVECGYRENPFLYKPRSKQDVGRDIGIAQST